MAIGHPRSCSITDRIPLFCVRRREAVEECYSGLAVDVTVRKGACVPGQGFVWTLWWSWL